MKKLQKVPFFSPHVHYPATDFKNDFSKIFHCGNFILLKILGLNFDLYLKPCVAASGCKPVFWQVSFF